MGNGDKTGWVVFGIFIVAIVFILYIFLIEVDAYDRECLEPLAEEICKEEVGGSVYLLNIDPMAETPYFRCLQGHKKLEDRFYFTDYELKVLCPKIKRGLF